MSDAQLTSATTDDKNKTNISPSNKQLSIKNSMLKYKNIQKQTCWIQEINLSRPLHRESQRLHKELRRYDNKLHSYLCIELDTVDILFENLEAKSVTNVSTIRCSLTSEKRLL